MKQIKRISFVLVIIFFALQLSAQKVVDEKVWLRWSPEVIDKANTAINAGYMSIEEQKVILLTNLARIDGPLFCTTFLSAYLEGEDTNQYTKSLYRELKAVNGLQPLYPENDLFKAAEGHAIRSGKNGQVGHQGFDARFKPLMKKYNAVAENCAYGYENAIDIVIQLLIDEGVPSLGHRKNMLNNEYNSIGVSIQPHKGYRYNCVMDFGGVNRP